MEVWLEILKQVPALAVLAYLTWKFLDHLSIRDDKFAARFIEIAEALGEVKEALRRLNGK